MTKKNQLVHVMGDDWCGLYLNGVLKTEGHSMSFSDIMEVVSEAGSIDYWTTLEADLDWLADEGSLPPALGEVRLIENALIPIGLIWS